MGGVVALVATPAVAQPWLSGRIEAGAYLGTEDSYPFGDATGLKDDVPYLLSNAELRGRPAWDSGEVWNFRVRGENLGIDSPWIDFDGGLQGLFRFRFNYQEIPRLQEDTSRTVFSGRGTEFLTLPPDWVPAPTTGGFAALDANLNRLNIGRDRKELRTGLDLVLPRGFEFVSNYRFERREGRRIAGMVIGNTGGNPRSSIVPESIDWRTHDVEAALRYADERMQFEVGYEFSQFDNRDDTLTFQNPFSAIGGWNPAAGFPTGFGRKALEPDNRFHQFRTAGGYNFPWWQTRLSAAASFGWLRQDDGFLPFTVNPALSVTTPLPRGNADGEIDTQNVLVRLSSRPLEKLRVHATYRFDNRDNDTDRDVFVGVPADSLDQAGPTSNRARINLPHSYRLHAGKIELGYEFLHRTELSGSYERRREERSFTDADNVDEDLFHFGLRSRFFRWADLRVSGIYQQRDMNDYDFQAFLQGFTPEYVATQPDDVFENNPFLRRFNLADRERTGVDARLMVIPHETVTLGASVAYLRDNFDSSRLGMRWRKMHSFSVDASWTPTETLTAHAWYTLERFDTRVQGRTFTPAPGQAFDATRDWRADDENDIDTVGAGVDWIGLDDRLELSANYAFSWAKNRIAVQRGSALPAAVPFPDTRSFLHNVSLQARYRLPSGLAARFGYLFERFDLNDWAFEDVGPATIGEVLSLGQQNPSYSAHLFAFSLEYHFDF